MPDGGGSAAVPRWCVFTAPALVERALDLIGWTAKDDLRTARLLEPAAGDGAFVVEAARRLVRSLRFHGTLPNERALANRIAAFEIEPSVASALRTNAASALEAEGVPSGVALRVVGSWCQNLDFLKMRQLGRFTHAAGNPPYSRGGGTAPDACVEFVNRSFHALKRRGRLAMICPLSMASSMGASDLRRAVTAGGTFDSVEPLEPNEAFTSRVDVIGGLFVATRDRASEPDASVTALPWMAGPADAREAVERLAGTMPTLEAAGCRVKLGMATGCNDAFVGYPEALGVEADLLLPALDTSDLANGKLLWRGRFVIDTHRPDGTPWQRAERPRLYSRLRKMEERLVDRATVRDGRSWRLTHSRVDHALAKVPKLLVPETGRRARVVLDPGGHMPLNSVHAITSSDWPLEALLAILGSAGVGLQAIALSFRRTGGCLRLNATGLRRVMIPVWRTLPDADMQCLLSGDPSQVAEAAARIYRLRDGLLRRCAAVGWEAV